MRVNVTPSSRRQQWWTDHVNEAPTAEEMLARTLRWMKAEIKACRVRRPADAAGFEGQMAHLIAGLLRDMPRNHPGPEFRGSIPPLPGGGWVPTEYAGPANNVVHP